MNVVWFWDFINNLCSVFFSPPNLRVKLVGDPLLENLAKFGYRSERRVKKFRIVLYFDEMLKSIV
jgi:hypothetical protein